MGQNACPKILPSSPKEAKTSKNVPQICDLRMLASKARSRSGSSVELPLLKANRVGPRAKADFENLGPLSQLWRSAGGQPQETLLGPSGHPGDLTLLLLLKNGQQIKEQDSKARQRYEFLVADYKPQFYFWDCFEMLRKVSITGILMFVGQQGSLFQHPTSGILHFSSDATAEAVVSKALCNATVKCSPLGVERLSA